MVFQGVPRERSCKRASSSEGVHSGGLLYGVVCGNCALSDRHGEGRTLSPFSFLVLGIARQRKFVDCMREEQEWRDINALTEAQENGLG